MKTLTLLALLAFASSSFAFSKIEPLSSQVPPAIQSTLSSPFYKKALAQIETSKLFGASSEYQNGTFVAGYTITAAASAFEGHVEIKIGASPNMWPSCTVQIATISADLHVFPDAPNGIQAENFVVTKLAQPVRQCP